jgi:hypothetical protein
MRGSGRARARTSGSRVWEVIRTTPSLDVRAMTSSHRRGEEEQQMRPTQIARGAAVVLVASSMTFIGGSAASTSESQADVLTDQTTTEPTGIVTSQIALRGGFSHKGGYKTCPRGQRIYVFVQWTHRPIHIKIFSSGSQPPEYHWRRYAANDDYYHEVFAQPKVRGGGWSVDMPGYRYITRAFARCEPRGELGPRSRQVPLKQCARGRHFQIKSIGSGYIVHRWIMGPPHLGYRWRKVVAGRHSGINILDNTTTGRRGVYSAQVRARGLGGHPGSIDITDSRCVKRWQDG